MTKQEEEETQGTEEGERWIKAGRPHSHPTTKPSISQAKALEPHHVQCRDRDSQDTSKLQPLPRDTTQFYLPRFNITDKVSKLQSFIKTTDEFISTLPCTGLGKWKKEGKGKEAAEEDGGVSCRNGGRRKKKKICWLYRRSWSKRPLPYFPND